MELVSHGALYTATATGIPYALVLELPPLTTGSPASEMTKSQNIPNTHFSFLIFLVLIITLQTLEKENLWKIILISVFQKLCKGAALV